jgi:fumarate hydratase subunit beta
LRSEEERRVVRELSLPLSLTDLCTLRAGDSVELTGTIFTARDAAHKRLVDALADTGHFPVDLTGQTIYYCGPTPAPPGRPIGSAGPTTSARMDAYAPTLHAAGVRATIGKGDRDAAVRESCRQHGAVYLVAVGGAGALLSDRICGARVVAYEDLGPEAVRELRVERFPAIVAYDAHGGSVFPGDEPLDGSSGS